MTPTDTAAVVLHPLERHHLAQTLTWANDPEFARLMDRARLLDPAEHDRWYTALGSRTDTVYFAVETAADGRHVGNVWLADIDPRHRKAEVRIVIGDRACMGRGIGRAAIDLAARYAFDVLGLHRVYAYVLAFNHPARRAFEKAGFTVEGTLRDDRRTGDSYVDAWVLGRVAPSL
jgi:RimJ/RimL family protein N-acetyltransferase